MRKLILIAFVMVALAACDSGSPEVNAALENLTTDEGVLDNRAMGNGATGTSNVASLDGNTQNMTNNRTKDEDDTDLAHDR